MKPRTLAMLGCLTLLSGGCDEDTTTPSEKKQVAVSEDEKKALELLEHMVGRQFFDPGTARDPDHLGAFLWLAENGTHLTEQAAALDALAQNIAHQRTDAADLRRAARVVQARLASKNPRIVGNALSAAIPLLKQRVQSAELRDQILKVGAELNTDGARASVLSTLAQVKGPDIHQPLVDFFAASVRADWPLASSVALQTLSTWLPYMTASRSKVAAAATEVLHTENPGAAGWALLVLANADAISPELLESYLTVDRHPFVAASACKAAGRTGDPRYLEALLRLSSDTRSTIFEEPSFKELSGRPGKLVHQGPGQGTLGEAAQAALAIYARGEVRLDALSKTEAPGPILEANRKKLARHLKLEDI